MFGSSQQRQSFRKGRAAGAGPWDLWHLDIPEGTPSTQGCKVTSLSLPTAQTDMAPRFYLGSGQ